MSIPTSTPSNISSGNISTKVNTPANVDNKVQILSDITRDLIIGYFPRLQNIPNMLHTAMSVWYLESSWNMWFTHGDSITPDSRHPGSAENSDIIRSYKNDRLIQNFLKSPNLSPQVKDNIEEGYWAHGLTGTMGCYFVAGVAGTNKPNFGRSSVRGLVTALGLEVQPGQPITSLFPYTSSLDPTVLEPLRRKSIASGLISLDYHYGMELNNTSDPYTAMMRAVGSYVGGKGAADIYGTTGDKRIAQVDSTGTYWGRKLAEVGVFRDGTPLPKAVAGAVSNDQTRVASTSAQKGSIPGCA